MTGVLNSINGCSQGTALGQGHLPGAWKELPIQLLMWLREITAPQVRRRIEFLFFFCCSQKGKASQGIWGWSEDRGILPGASAPP